MAVKSIETQSSLVNPDSNRVKPNQMQYNPVKA